MQERNHEILDRNWRWGRYEIDLVTRISEIVAFVEVKTRRLGVERPDEGLAPAQRRRIRRAAEAWIHTHPGVGREFRFDLVAVEIEPAGGVRIRHLPDAFHGEHAI